MTLDLPLLTTGLDDAPLSRNPPEASRLAILALMGSQPGQQQSGSSGNH